MTEDASGVNTPSVANVPALSLQMVASPTELAQCAQDWKALLLDSASPEPMLTADWMITWWDHYGQNTGRQLRVGLFRHGERLVGLAPLIRRLHRYRHVLPFRRLEMLGSDVEEADGVCSEYLNVIARRGYERAVSTAFARALYERQFGPWDEFLLGNMDGTGPLLPWLAEACCAVGLSVHTHQRASAPYATLPATWAEFLASLSPKKRRFLQQTWSRFERWAGDDMQFHTASTLEELTVGSRILRDLHQARWTKSGQPGVFASPRFSAFHEATMRRLLQEGRLELTWLIVRGQPIAAHYNMLANGKTYYYQCGRKLDLPRDIYPGAILVIHALHRAIARGDREFDFLADTSIFKRHFTHTERPIVELRVARHGFREFCRSAAQRTLARLRSLRHVAPGTGPAGSG